MKMTKKVLLGAAVLAAASFGFMGCGPDDDDPNDMISKSDSKNYSIEYENASDTVSRGFETTTFQHLGEIVKLELTDETATSANGVIGFIWDLRYSNKVKDSASTAKDARDFFVVGFRNQEGELQYYVSKYFNVVDTQAWNFGAGTITTGNTGTADKVTTYAAGIAADAPKELVVKDFTKLNATFAQASNNGTLTVWLDIYPVYDKCDYGVNGDKYYTITNDKRTTVKTDDDAVKAGSYIIDIYSADPEDEGIDTDDILDTVIIAPEQTGYTAKPDQGYLAVYANVYARKTLKGSWNLAKDYAEAEVIEDAE